MYSVAIAAKPKKGAETFSLLIDYFKDQSEYTGLGKPVFRLFGTAARNLVIGVFVFVGLTAYDTQRIKDIYLANDNSVVASKKAIMGALALYLDFLNLFILLLQLTGNRRQ